MIILSSLDWHWWRRHLWQIQEIVWAAGWTCKYALRVYAIPFCLILLFLWHKLFLPRRMWRFLHSSCRESSIVWSWGVRKTLYFTSFQEAQYVHLSVSDTSCFVHFQEMTSKPMALACRLAATWSIYWMYPSLLCQEKSTKQLTSSHLTFHFYFPFEENKGKACVAIINVLYLSC